MAVAAWATLAQVRAHPVPSFTNCLRGQEVSALRLAAAGAPTEQARFLLGDEAGYLRAADQRARGQVATDYLGDLLQAVREAPVDEALRVASPLYRTALGFAAVAPPDRPGFVSYRSVVFSAFAVPWIARMGCDSATLLRLRESMVVWRVLLVAASAWLAWQLVGRGQQVLALAVAWLVALDAQLNAAASTFMPDVPGAALALLWLALLVRLVHSPRSGTALALGLLGALTVLVKMDFLYVVPVAMLAAVLASRPDQRRWMWRAVGIAALTYGMTLAGFAARNHAHTGAWFITSKDTVNLYLGNDEDAAGRGYRYGMTTREWQVMERIPLAYAATASRDGAELALRQGLRDELLERVRHQPVAVVRGLFAKAALFMTSDGVHHYPLLGDASLVLSSAVMTLGWVGVLALARCGNATQRAVAVVLATAFALAFAIVCAVCVEVRYLSHLTPMASVLAAFAASVWWGHRRQQAIGRTGGDARGSGA